MERKYEAARDAGLLDEPRFSAFRHISSAVDEHGKKSYPVGYGVTQFVWGMHTQPLLRRRMHAVQDRTGVCSDG
jgi:hypothetical protein